VIVKVIVIKIVIRISLCSTGWGLACPGEGPGDLFDPVDAQRDKGTQYLLFIVRRLGGLMALLGWGWACWPLLAIGRVLTGC
jgi:hypothetical protein